MDPNSTLEAITEGAKATSKLEEIIQKILGPRWTRKQADADAYADAKKLQTIRDNPDMVISYVNGEINARERTFEEIKPRAQNRLLVEATRQQNNIENILSMAAPTLLQLPDNEISDDNVDDDWLTRFASNVKDISAEELQLVWSKILVGEIKRPGSFSLRTLDVIRNISRAEAEIFQKVAPFALVNGSSLVIPQDEEILSKYGINYRMLMQLDESGLLNINGTTAVTGKVAEIPTIIAKIDRYYFTAYARLSHEVKFHCEIYPFTKAGYELYSILSHDVDESYLKTIARKMQNKNKEISVTLFKCGEADETGHAPLIAVDID